MGSQSRWWPFAALFGSSKAEPSSETKHPYHAVSIVPGAAESCGAARRFKSVRFLSKDAPRLPLPSCNCAQCTCRFKHHRDRRAGPRRRSDQGMMAATWNASERRRVGGRRADDHS